MYDKSIVDIIKESKKIVASKTMIYQFKRFTKYCFSVSRTCRILKGEGSAVFEFVAGKRALR